MTSCCLPLSLHQSRALRNPLYLFPNSIFICLNSVFYNVSTFCHQTVNNRGRQINLNNSVRKYSKCVQYQWHLFYQTAPLQDSLHTQLEHTKWVWQRLLSYWQHCSLFSKLDQKRCSFSIFSNRKCLCTYCTATEWFNELASHICRCDWLFREFAEVMSSFWRAASLRGLLQHDSVCVLVCDTRT